MAGLAALGGIGRGISRGAKDIRDWEDERFRKKARARQEQTWAEEDDLKAQVKAAPVEGQEYSEDLQGPPVEGETTAGVVTKKRTGEEAARAMQGIYQRANRPELAMQYGNRAEGLKEKAKGEELLRRVQTERELAATDPGAYFVANREFYKQVPDGMDYAVQSTANGPAMVHFDSKGVVKGTIPITRDLALAVADAKAQMIMEGHSPEMFLKLLDSRLANRRHEETVGLQRSDLAERSRHNQAVEANQRLLAQAARDRAGRENAALAKLDKLDALSGEAQGIRMGLTRAQQLGPEGVKAAGIYKEMMDGINARLTALGVRPQSTDNKDPIERLKLVATLAQTMPYNEAQMLVDQAFGGAEGADERIAARLRELAGNKQPVGGGKEKVLPLSKATDDYVKANKDKDDAHRAEFQRRFSSAPKKDPQRGG